MKRLDWKKEFPQIEKMATAHYCEVSPDEKFNPDWNQYTAMDAAGLLRLYGDHAGRKLRGYAIFIVLNHYHNKDEKLALCDAVYLHPDYRKGSAGIHFLLGVEPLLKQEGIEKVIYSVRPKRDFSKVLLRHGYDLLETNYEKHLR